MAVEDQLSSLQDSLNRLQNKTIAVNAASRTSAEIGSPEFAEDRTQINSLNNKWILAQEMIHFTTDLVRSRDHQGDLQSRGLQALTEAVNLQVKVNQEYLSGHQDMRKTMAEIRGNRMKWADMWAYNQGYDIANPIAVGAGADVGAGSTPANRITDTSGAVAGAGINADVAGIITTLAKQMDATNTAVLAVLQQIVEALATTNASVANVLAQVQPKNPPATPTA